MNDNNEVNSEPFEYTLSLLSGKWKMSIIFWLWHRKIMRYGELKKSISKITHKMLSRQLKKLENAKLIIRTEYPEIPPRVVYCLSNRGLSLMPILKEMCKWGYANYLD